MLLLRGGNRNKIKRAPFAAVLLGALALMFGAAPSAAQTPSADVERIIYETFPGPFCGACERVRMTVYANGWAEIETGRYYGRYADLRWTRRQNRITRAEFTAFAERLAPYRPESELLLDSSFNCAVFEGGRSGVRVTWRAGGGEARLNYNLGCDREARAEMVDALREAPSLLGITGLPPVN